ncbi:MAG: putative pH adaptation potassium efflux system protein [Pseudomonadota bacterium]
MSALLTWSITLTQLMFLAAITLSVLRVLRGPTAQDRVLALDFIYVVAMLCMLLLAIRYDSSMYFEGALLMVLFGYVSSVALAKFLLRGEVIE